MPDIADAHAAFQKAKLRAESAAGITRDGEGNEVYSSEETPVVTPELQDATPVVASDQEQLATEPVVEETVDTSEQQEVEQVATPTVEELQAQIAIAEARLAEKENMIGRQSTEVGEVRQQMAELQAQISALQTPITPPATIQITQELIDTRPDVATQAAYTQRNDQALQIAFDAWKEIDPFTASTWLSDKKLEQVQAAHKAELEQIEKRFETVAAPLAETAEQQQWKLAFDEVRTKHPDVFIADPETGQTGAEALITAAGTRPEYETFKNLLQDGDASAKAAALSALYALEKMGNPQALQKQLEEEAKAAADEVAAARLAAGAVTAQTTAGQPGEQKTAEELEQEQYLVRQKSKPSLARGWTGRS